MANMPEAELKRLRQYGWFLLARRDYSEFELTQKLLTKGASPEQCTLLIQAFQARGWQSDLRFAENYTHYRSQKGMGPLKVAQTLKQRGIDSALIKDILSEDPQTWLEQAKRVRQKRFGATLPKDRQIQFKQMQFLRQRGFTMQTIQAVFANMTEIDDEYDTVNE